MSLSVTITAALADAASQMTTQVLHQAIARLAVKYGFDAAEAIQFINLAPARPEVLKKTDLPWCGKVFSECCTALTYRGGLYTQCHKAIVADALCGACAKQKAETGTLKNGDINDRLAASPFDFLGGKVTRFSKLMEKNGWTQEFVELSAAEYGLTIPPENFIAAKPKRGRKVTRPVMVTPEPPAMPTAEPEAVVAFDPLFSDEAPTLDATGMPLPTAPHGFTTYSATDPDSDDELEAEPVPAPKAKKEKVKKVKAADSDSGSGSESAAEAKKEKKVKKEKKEKVDSPAEEAPVSTPTPPKEKKAAVDYSTITAVEAATMKPMALRTACAQHGIELGTKNADTLRAELITKLTA